MKKIIDDIIRFENELKANDNLTLIEFNYFNSPANISQLNELETGRMIEKSVLDFYRISDGFEISWDADDDDLHQGDINGRLKINPFQQVVTNWKGVVYFDNEPAESPVRKFFPMDFFANEAAVGFCTKEGYQEMLYFFNFEDELKPLCVNIRGYLQLMLLAKACYYWQYLILDILDESESEVSQRIKTRLSKIFPGFSFQAFSEKFNEVRLSQF